MSERFSMATQQLQRRSASSLIHRHEYVFTPPRDYRCKHCGAVAKSEDGGYLIPPELTETAAEMLGIPDEPTIR